MDPVHKALWFIESHFRQELTLEEVADAGGVSRFHMSRVFAITMGYSIMRYVRGRRLTEAARALVKGAPDILDVALDVGYGSHEAFTRAFREQFGLTPEAVRAQGNLNNISLMEAIKMQETVLATIEARFEKGRVFLIGGMGERYTCETSAGIPAQWQRFVPHLGNIPGQVSRVAYGVNCNFDDEGNFDYICGVEVTDFTRLPRDWSRVRIPAQEYALFSHRDHMRPSAARGARSGISGCRNPDAKWPTRRTSNATEKISIPGRGTARSRSGCRSKMEACEA
jgi:AraC family transcriptional regulator